AEARRRQKARLQIRRRLPQMEPRRAGGVAGRTHESLEIDARSLNDACETFNASSKGRNMELSRANDLLNPGYLPFESGYWDLADGKRLVAALTRMPGCRAKMVHWWFSWLGGTEQYKLWHPRDHVFSGWENRHDGKYIGASHLVHEYLAGPSGPLFKLRINFHDPAEMFDARRYREAGVVAVCARIGDLEHPVNFGRMVHFVRDTDYG